MVNMKTSTRMPIVSFIFVFMLDSIRHVSAQSSNSSSQRPSSGTETTINPKAGNDDSKAIIYGAVGGSCGLVLLIVIIVAIVCVMRRRKKKRRPADEEKVDRPKSASSAHSAGSPKPFTKPKSKTAARKDMAERNGKSDKKAPKISLRDMDSAMNTALSIQKSGKDSQKSEKGSEKSAPTKKAESQSSVKSIGPKSAVTAKSGSKSKSSGSVGSSDTLKGYPESPDEKKEMLAHTKSPYRKLPPAPGPVASGGAGSLRTARGVL